MWRLSCGDAVATRLSIGSHNLLGIIVIIGIAKVKTHANLIHGLPLLWGFFSLTMYPAQYLGTCG